MEEKFLGKMVIVRSQEQEPIRVGIIEKWVSVGNSIFPMINFEGKKKLCVSGVLPYNARLAEMLSSMSPDEGRHLVDEIVKMIQTTGKPERKKCDTF